MPNMISYNYCMMIHSPQASLLGLRRVAQALPYHFNMVPGHQTVCPSFKILAQWIVLRCQLSQHRSLISILEANHLEHVLS